MLETISHIIDFANGIVWDTPASMPWMIVLLLGTGLFTAIRMGFIQLFKVGHAISVVSGKYDDPSHGGDINHFQALATALSATVGIGNIAGVATAIHLGGPGAVFWMWITAIFGMSLKYVECTLATRYRTTDDAGEAAGGPMYTIERGLGSKWKWMAIFFAFCGVMASFGGGNMNQSNSVAEASIAVFGLGGQPMWRYLIGIGCALLVGAVILGGIKRIGSISGRLAPAMAILYFVSALIVLLLNAGEIPGALMTIVSEAFNPTASVTGSVAGGLMTGLIWGVKRGLFSNEAGQGSAPIAHAAAKTDEPVREGVVAMLGPLIDTLIICTMTALTILVTGVWEERYPDEVILGNTVIGAQLETLEDETPNAYNQRVVEPSARAAFFRDENGAGKQFTVANGFITGETTSPLLFIHNDAPMTDVQIFSPDGAAPFNGILQFNTEGELIIPKTVDAQDPTSLILRGKALQTGSVMTANAFRIGLMPVFGDNVGDFIVAICVILFAVSTIVSWSYYGDRCAVYLFGSKSVLPFRIAYTFFVFCGAAFSLETVWSYGDLSMGLMTVPNLISVWLLAGLVRNETKDYFNRMQLREQVEANKG